MAGSKIVLGIDVTQERISMALVKKQGDKFRILKAAECPVPEGTIKNGNVENPHALASAIKILKNKNRMFAGRAAMSLVANPVLSQILDIPKDVAGNIRQFINNEVKHYAALPIKNATLDFCKIKSSSISGGRRVLLIATDGQKISNSIETLYKKGINIDVIEPAWMSYARANYDKVISKNANTNMLFVMVNKDIFTTFLFKDQKLDYIKIQPIESLQNESEKYFDFLTEQINSVIKFYEYGGSRQNNKWLVNIFSQEKLDFNTKEIEILESKLSDKVKLEIINQEDAYLNTPVDCGEAKHKPSPVAIGLALKLLSSNNDDLNINLMPAETILTKMREKKMLIVANIAAALVVIMIISVMFFNTKIATVKANTNKNGKVISAQDTKMMLTEQAKLDEEIKQISTKLDNIANIIHTDSITQWGLILNDLGLAIPADIRLTSIHSTDSGILLSGQALSYDAIYLFIDSLNKSESIKSAAIVGTTNNGQSDKFINYSISCALNQ